MNYAQSLSPGVLPAAVGADDADLLALDLKRKAMRTFSLTRVRKAELGKGRFTLSKGFDADGYLRDNFGVFKGEPEGDYEVVVDFDAWAADEIRGRTWHRSQAVTELPKGWLRLRLRLNNLEEVQRWLLSFGEHVTVARPRVLRERLLKVGGEYVGRYGE